MFDWNFLEVIDSVNMVWMWGIDWDCGIFLEELVWFIKLDGCLDFKIDLKLRYL